MTIKFWNETIPPSVSVSLFYIIICCVNFFGSKCYADVDCFFNCLKVVMMIAFVFVGLLIDMGLIGHQKALNFTYFEKPGFFNAEQNLFKGIVTTLLVVSFSMGGLEFVALCCAEQKTKNKLRNIKQAGLQVVLRIFLIYCLSTFIIGLLVPFNSPYLMGSDSDSMHASPYVLAIAINGVGIAPHIFNSVILLSILSVANNAMYSSSRTLHSLSEQGFAMDYFKKLVKSGKPRRCLIVSAVIGLFAFIAEYKYQEKVFMWLLSISGLSTIFTWSMICVSHIRFRKALQAQNQNQARPGYRAITGVFGSYLALAINLFILITHGWVSLFPIEENGKLNLVSFFKTT